MVTKGNKVEIEEAIMEILGKENRSISIREIKLRLERFGIRKSPQIIKRHLEVLIKKGKILEE